MLLDENFPEERDTLKLWQTLLTEEQQKVFSSLNNETVVIEETLRIQQQQVHFVREEADLLALNAKAECYLEEEQEVEHQSLLEFQNRQAEAEAARRPLERALYEKFLEEQQKEESHANLQKSYKLLQLQLLKLQRARETFNVRMQQKAERHQRERRELQAANERRSKNMPFMLEMELANLPKEKREAAIKLHKAEAGHMKVLQTRLAEQLREIQLLQQRNAQKAFEYDQNCKMAEFQLEATHMSEMQRKQQDHSLQLANMQGEVKQKIYELKAQQQKKEHQKLMASNMRKKQRLEAKRLRKQQQRDAYARQEARRAGMESDFVEFLSCLQLSGMDSEKASTITESLVSCSSVGWDEEAVRATMDSEAQADLTTLDRVDTQEDSESKLLALHQKEVESKEEMLQTRVEQMRQKLAVIEKAMASEHSQALRMLQRKHQQGAISLQAKMEDETKAIRLAHASEKQILQEEQEKALDNLRQTISLKLEMDYMNEEHKRNLNDFLSFVCHELRNPLCGISACLELIKLHPSSDGLHPEIRKHVEIMGHQSTMMKAILNDVLDMRKIEEGKLEYVCVPLNLHALMDEIVFAQRSFATQLKNNNHTEAVPELLVDIEAGVPDTVRGDPTRVRQVMSNLLSNALKFTPQGKVAVSVRVVKKKQQQHLDADAEGYHMLYFEVKDTGMSKQTVDRLFKKYQQAQAREHCVQTAGTGLGLAICKALITQMGGDIGVTSELGKGSLFWFTLPFQQDPSSTPTPLLEDSTAGRSPVSRLRGSESLAGNLQILKQRLSPPPPLDVLGHLTKPAPPLPPLSPPKKNAEEKACAGDSSACSARARGIAREEDSSALARGIAREEDSSARTRDAGAGEEGQQGGGGRAMDATGELTPQASPGQPDNLEDEGATQYSPGKAGEEEMRTDAVLEGPPPRPPVLLKCTSAPVTNRKSLSKASVHFAPPGGPAGNMPSPRSSAEDFGLFRSTPQGQGGQGGEGVQSGQDSQSQGQGKVEGIGDVKRQEGRGAAGNEAESDCRGGGGGGRVKEDSKPSKQQPPAQSTASTKTMTMTRPSGPRCFPGHLRVLLAEDSPMLQITGTAMLSRLGITADVAKDGEVALQMCDSKDYHLVILDVQMPKYSGDQVAERLRQRGFSGAMVACTANAMPSQVNQYMALGIDEVLVKPYTLEELSNMISRVVPAPILEE